MSYDAEYVFENTTLDVPELDRELDCLVDLTKKLIQQYKNPHEQLARGNAVDTLIRRNIYRWVTQVYPKLTKELEEEGFKQTSSALTNLGAISYYNTVDPRMKKLAEDYHKIKGDSNGKANSR